MRLILLITAIFMILPLMVSCAETTNTIAPDIELSASDPGLNSPQNSGNAYLWGYYDVYLDIENQRVEAIENRQSMFTANVVNFVNSQPSGLRFNINDTPVGPDYVDVDIDVSITHPFSGMPQYHGYDVRGVFMGNGSANMIGDPDLFYAIDGVDQTMLPDTVDGHGGPDGYTRWFNLPEFSNGGMPMFQYTPGNLATPGFNGSATLNPYKYFADGLNETEDTFTWLNDHTGQSGQFSSGATNTRNYYLRFPNTSGVYFGYAIIANWEGIEDEDHPSNAPESVACQVNDTSTVYYVDPGNNGGLLRFDISLFNWAGQPSTITIESTVLSAPYQLTPTDMSPIGGSEFYSTYQVEITADNIEGVEGNEYWVIAEQTGFDYSNEYEVPNDAENETLQAYFRYDLDVSSVPGDDPVCDIVIDPASPSMPYDGWGIFTFDASGSYDPNGLDLTFEWDFNNDGIFGDSYESGTDQQPVKLFDFTNQAQVCVRVQNTSGGESICCVDVDIIGYPTKNIELLGESQAVDVTIDHINGDLLILYEDKTIYRRLRSEYYQNETLFIPLGIHHPKIMYAIDMPPNQYIGIALTYVTDVTPGFFVYDADQVFNQYFGQGPPDSMRDAYSFASGLFENDMGFVRGRVQPYSGDFLTIILRGTLIDGTYAYGGVHTYLISDGITTGIDRIYYSYIQGVETDVDGEYLWILEDPDYYVSRWLLSESGNLDYLDYDNAYFGTGSQTDDDDGWNDARDITRDNLNQFFVLDELSSGEPRIKMWSVDGDTTTSEGGFADSSSISGDPISIEGSDFSEEIVVLHGDTPPCMFSVFLPIEMP